VPLLGCQKVPRHQLEKYTTQGPDVNNRTPYFRRHVPAFQADLGTTNPSPLGGISLSRFVELLVLLDAGKRRRPRCQRELL
jgi:hypothetical protein